MLSIVTTPSRHSWNLALGNLTSGNLDQIYEFAEARKKAYAGSEIIRLMALEDERPVGLIQGVYQRRLGYSRNLTIGGSCGCFPVISLEGKKEQIVRFLLEGLEDFGRRNRIVEGHVYWSQQWGFPVLEDLGYRVNNIMDVCVVDLRGSSRDLWDRIHHNKRKNVRKAEHAQIVVEDTDSDEDFQSFLRLWKATSIRVHFDRKFVTPTEVQEMWKTFKQKGMARVFLAKYKGQDVAGTLIVFHGDTAYSRYAGSLDEAWSVRPNDMVHWKAMEWACEHGYSWYHMGGLPYPEPQEGMPFWGLWRWKREWRGTIEKRFVFTKVYLPGFKKILDKSRRMINASRKLIS